MKTWEIYSRIEEALRLNCQYKRGPSVYLNAPNSTRIDEALFKTPVQEYMKNEWEDPVCILDLLRSRIQSSGKSKPSELDSSVEEDVDFGGRHRLLVYKKQLLKETNTNDIRLRGLV